MNTYTKDRAPTANEVAAHAAAHGVDGRGWWLIRDELGYVGVEGAAAHDMDAVAAAELATPLEDGRPVPWPGEPGFDTLLDTLRDVWRKVTGDEAPLLLVLERRFVGGDGSMHDADRFVWALRGPRRMTLEVWAAHRRVTGGVDIIDHKLMGVTDLRRAAAIIAEHVLGGDR